LQIPFPGLKKVWNFTSKTFVKKVAEVVRKEAGKCNKVPVFLCPFEEKKVLNLMVLGLKKVLNLVLHKLQEPW
jgi:hypothetical protein